ncbi:unnamed protein product [Adineta steineri]|uniref:Uncharacterized protein n=1 Tax=Adineta steineri TaxID=433720 RepID=A0A815VR72_9BILA|nr:unnamed protein product [Adineta steineri]CAF1533704.1 unnamed protein product [Adineta steineri]
MSEEANHTVARAEANANQATADENVRELRKEEEEEVNDDSDDEVVATTGKPERPIAISKPNTDDKDDKVKKEPPEMNIQLQH